MSEYAGATAAPEFLERDRKAAREQRRARDIQRHEEDLRRAYLETPGADEAGWEKEKGAILAADRADRAVKNKAAARRSQATLYRSF
jgi:hypothetical protein